MSHPYLKHLAAAACATLLVVASACKTTQPDYGRALPDGAPALLPLGPDEVPPRFTHDYWAKQEMLPALEQSIAWMKKKSSPQFFPIEGVTHERALKSLERFKELLETAKDGDDFEAQVLA